MKTHALKHRLVNISSLKIWQKTALVLLGTFIIALSAQINLGILPVPVTLQTLAVFFVAMFYGWRLGTITVIAYLIEGLCGLPVFAGFAFGPAALLGPSGGYLLGFVPAALVSGFLAEHGFAKHMLTVFIAGLIGEIIIYAAGLSVLSRYVAHDQVIKLGLTPFILGDVLKLIFLSIIIPFCYKRK